MGARILIIDGNVAEIRARQFAALGYDSGVGYARVLHRVDPSLRIDIVAKSTGTAVYGIDLRMPDMVYATVRANPRLGGGMKGYDAGAFFTELRKKAVTLHVAQHARGRRSAIDGRTTRHPGYAVSQHIRKRVEGAFGWAKTVAGLREMRTAGCPRSAGNLPCRWLPMILSGCPNRWPRPRREPAFCRRRQTRSENTLKVSTSPPLRPQA